MQEQDGKNKFNISERLEDLRREVALVTQEHHVFLGTIRDNVTLGRDDASDDDGRLPFRPACAACGCGRPWRACPTD